VKPQNIVYAYDVHREKKLPHTQLVPWVRLFTNELTVLEVIGEPNVISDKNDPFIQGILSKIPDDIRLHFETVYSDEPALSIHHYVINKDSDVLALCTTQRNFIEGLFHKSVIKHISNISSYPVFIFHK
jgi:hypothetical protein